jgi:hypothetical protein
VSRSTAAVAVAPAVGGGLGKMAKVTVTVTEDMVSEEYRWLLPSVVPYMDLIIRAFLRARTQVEYGDMLSAPDGFASRENLNRILDKRMRIVAASPTPPLAADHRWGFVRHDPRTTVDARLGLFVLVLGRAYDGFPSLPGVEDGWHLRVDLYDVEAADPAEVRYKRELEALVRVDPECEWVTRFLVERFAGSVGRAVSCPEWVDSARSSLIDDRSLRMLPNMVRGLLEEQVLPGLYAAAVLVDVIAWMAVRSGRCEDLVQGAVYAKNRVFSTAWPAGEDHVSFMRRAREFGDCYYNGTWRKRFFPDADLSPKLAQFADRHITEFPWFADKLAELGLAGD